MLVMSNRKDGEKKNLLKYQSTFDGISTWIDFLNDYEYSGSQEFRAAELKKLIRVTYTSRTPGGLKSYIDTLQANLNELAILLPYFYFKGQTWHILFQNLQDMTALNSLIQTCKDQDYTYMQSVQCLRTYGASHEDSNPRLIQHTELEQDSSFTLEQARTILHSMAKESSLVQVFHTLNTSATLCNSLSIPLHIWKLLSKEFQTEIQQIRKQISEKEDAAKTLPFPKPSNQKIPLQYGLTLDKKAPDVKVDRHVNVIVL